MKRNRSGRGCGGAGARRCRWSNATLENANLDLFRACDAHELNIGLMWKISVSADFIADVIATSFAGD